MLSSEGTDSIFVNIKINGFYGIRMGRTHNKERLHPWIQGKCRGVGVGG